MLIVEYFRLFLFDGEYKTTVNLYWQYSKVNEVNNETDLLHYISWRNAVGRCWRTLWVAVVTVSGP